MSFHLYTGANVSKTLQSSDLIAIINAGIEVKNLSGDLVNLFEDKLGTIPQVNPFVADDTGQFYFYIEQGEYNLKITKGTSSSTIAIEFTVSGEVLPVDITTNALTITDEDHGKMFNISDSTGSVSIDCPVIPEDAVGMIVFIRSKTDSPIQFVPGAGVTIESAYSLNIYAKFSLAAIVYTAVDTVALTGDLQQ